MKSSDPCDESLVLAGCCLGCCSVILRSVCGKLPNLSEKLLDKLKMNMVIIVLEE